MQNSSSPTLTNVTISGNSAGANSGGGGLRSLNSSPTLTNVTISGNYSSFFSGGGVLLVYSDPTLTNVAITDNWSNYDGGGMSLYSSSLTLTNVTISGNEAIDSGGGMSLDNSSATLTNVIISGNSASSGGGMYLSSGSPALTYCNAWGNTPDNYSNMTDPTGTDGNISVDPEFLDTTDPDPINWDLHLTTSSPLIDAGDPNILDPDGSPSDIGIYGGPDAEFWDMDNDGWYEWWQPGEYDYVNYPAFGWDCDDQDDTVYPGNGC